MSEGYNQIHYHLHGFDMEGNRLKLIHSVWKDGKAEPIWIQRELWESLASTHEERLHGGTSRIKYTEENVTEPTLRAEIARQLGVKV